MFTKIICIQEHWLYLKQGLHVIAFYFKKYPKIDKAQLFFFFFFALLLLLLPDS